MNIKFYVSKRDKMGDYVRCCDCGREMVVKCGSEDCPSCGGALVWAAPEGEHEVNVAAFKQRLRQGD